MVEHIFFSKKQIYKFISQYNWFFVYERIPYKLKVNKKMTTINFFSKIFRSLIILLFILFTFSSFNINSYTLGQDNICTSEKKDIDNKCENDCLCDRDNIVHAEDYRTFTLNKAQINNYKIFLTKQKFIEKINSPPIIYLF